MKQKSFESILRRLQGLTPDQLGALMRYVQDLTAQNAALGAIDQKARKTSVETLPCARMAWGHTQSSPWPPVFLILCSALNRALA